jgi:hypothetical protein
MTTDSNDRRTNPEPAQEQGNGTTPPGGERLNAESRLTRRLQTTRPIAERPRRTTSASREQIAALVAALGEPEHPLHAGAVDALVQIGVPAVPALNAAMAPDQPWLSAYRAAEAAGRIGDGRATNALIGALQHPNSNVRWSAVRALTQAGDMRAMLELHRVAQNDQGRTSWGESVAGAAQSALDQVRSRSVWGQSLDLIKTAVVSVMMLLALIFAFSSVSTLRRELDSFGQAAPNQVLEPLLLPTLTPAPTREAQPTAEPLAAATAVVTGTALPSGPTTAPLATGDGPGGTILQAANIRPEPSTDNEPIGQVQAGEPIIFVARTADSQWYRIRLAPEADPQSRINNPDGSGSGWVNQALVSEPSEDVPVEDVEGAGLPTTRRL